MIYDAIVIGAGPSGLMTSNILEKGGLNYLLLEKNERPGKKLLITGGRRCNVTNNLSVEAFIASLTFKHKRFLYGALSAFGPSDVINYFKDQGLNLVLEENMKFFPETGKSSSVLEALLKNINVHRLKVNHFVKDIEKSDDVFFVKTNHDSFQTRSVVVATGSNSFPSTGSNGDGLIFAKRFQIETIAFTPAETYVYSNYVKDQLADLQGVSLSNARVKINGTKIQYQGDLIFTHFGLSGPVILHLSEDIYKELLDRSVSISFNITEIMPDQINRLFDQAKKSNTTLLKLLESITTKRLAKKVLELAQVENKHILEISKKDIQTIFELLMNFTVEIDRVEVKEKAYVNAGGISTKEIDPKTMEIKKVKGLYFIGETVDVHGPIGGYNITIGLSMGFRCAQHIIENHMHDDQK